MQDVSRVSGDPVVVHSKLKDRDFVLRGMTFEDLGVLQKIFLREKRLAMIEAAKLRAEGEDAATRKQIIDDAQREAASIAYLSDQDFQQRISTVAGAVEFLWVLFERQYPGVVSRTELLKMANTNELPADTIGDLVAELFAGSSEGN